MCVSTNIQSRELAVMSYVLVLSSSHESQLSCHVGQYYYQATRVSCHVMCVSTIIKSRELAVMSQSCVLVLSSSHESQRSCHSHLCQYYHKVTIVSGHVTVMCVSTIIKSRELAVISCVLVLSSSHEGQRSCHSHVCQYYHQATRGSGHVTVTCVSTFIKPRELAVMSQSCVLILSSSHESQRSCPV